MSLTSGTLQLLLFCLAAIITVATALLWRGLSRPSVGLLLARLGLLAAGQLMLILAVLAYVNAIFDFYGSWSELFGSAGVTTTAPRPATTTPKTVRHTAVRQYIQITGASSGVMYGADGTTLPIDQVAVSPGQDLAASLGPRAAAIGATSGLVIKITISGPYSGVVSTDNYVYLPPQYFQKAYATARFPVLMQFAGYPNAARNEMRLFHLPQIAAQMVAARQINPMILLMVNPSVALPADTECTNAPAGLQVATFFGRDVPLATELAFRARTARTGWAMSGYSTGGYCAVKLAMLYPGQFSAAVSMAGYFTSALDHTTGPLYGGSAADRNENSPAWRLLHLPAPPASVLLCTTWAGEYTLRATLDFLGEIHAPMRGYSLILPSGGHNYTTWERELPQSLEWLSDLMTPPGPAGGGRFPGCPGGGDTVRLAEPDVSRRAFSGLRSAAT